ncbi:MAG: hypothetical protein ACXWLR_07900 [Myxococcales bacterium]
MKRRARQTAQLGDLVVTAFDSAAECSTDPAEVSRLARQMVMHLLRHARSAFPPASPPDGTRQGATDAAAGLEE